MDPYWFIYLLICILFLLALCLVLHCVSTCLDRDFLIHHPATYLFSYAFVCILFLLVLGLHSSLLWPDSHIASADQWVSCTCCVLEREREVGREKEEIDRRSDEEGRCRLTSGGLGFGEGVEVGSRGAALGLSHQAVALLGKSLFTPRELKQP